MNVPYVKQFDSTGTLTNPIEKFYHNESPNRKQRRSGLKKQRFHGESSNLHLAVTPMGTYIKFRQQICVGRSMFGRPIFKVIEHYLQK